jgi:exo-1,4-beta-D-glucosaminidase
MLNNAWPSVIWHLYDYSLRAAGGFHGTKKACEPLHVQYSYDDRSVVVVNEHPSGFPSLKVEAAAYDLSWKELFTKTVTADVAAEAALRVLTLPEPAGWPTTYFVRLRLSGADGREVSRNFYWLSTRPDVLDYENAPWFYTPTKAHADFTALASLPPARLEVKLAPAGADEGAVETSLHVTVTNTSDVPAFQVKLTLTDGPGGPDVIPAYWEDNYFELAPRESRELRVTCPRRGVSTPLAVAVGGWNVKS